MLPGINLMWEIKQDNRLNADQIYELLEDIYTAAQNASHVIGGTERTDPNLVNGIDVFFQRLQHLVAQVRDGQSWKSAILHDAQTWDRDPPGYPVMTAVLDAAAKDLKSFGEESVPSRSRGPQQN